MALCGVGAGGFILVLIVVLPSLVMIYVSFITYVHVPSAKTWELLTLDNYHRNLSDTRTYRALQNSLFLAVVGATVCMFLAALTAWVTTKTKTVGRGVIEALTFIPWAFPGTALAIGLLWTYVYIPLPIYGTLWILLIGYVTRFLPYGLRTMTSTIVQLHDDLQQASMVCGASFLTTFRRISCRYCGRGLLPVGFFWRRFFCASSAPRYFFIRREPNPWGRCSTISTSTVIWDPCVPWRWW